MQYKTFWVIFGASLSLAGAVVPTLFRPAWWVTALGISAIYLAAMLSCSPVVQTADMFKYLTLVQKFMVTSFIRLGISTYVIWTALFVVRPELWVYWLVVLPFAAMAVYWGSRGVEYRIAHEKPREEKPVCESPATSGDQEMIDRFRPVLNKAGYHQVKVLRHEEVVEDDGTLAASQFLVQTPASGR